MRDERFKPLVDARPEDVPWPEMVWPPPVTALTGTIVELTLLDPWRDSPELFAALDDPRVWAHLLRKPNNSDEYAEILHTLAEKGYLQWLVRLTAPLHGLAAGAVVGTTAYLDVSVADALVEIGSTAYSPTVWASTINPECKLLLMTLAFETLHAGRVQLKTDIRNARSQQAIARLGARYEGVLRRHKRRVDGSMRDSVMFSVIAEEWPEVKAGLQSRL